MKIIIIAVGLLLLSMNHASAQFYPPQPVPVFNPPQLPSVPCVNRDIYGRPQC